MNMNSFNWFNDLSSILTQDLATAAVEETDIRIDR